MGSCISKAKSKQQFSAHLDLLDLDGKQNYLVLVPAGSELPVPIQQDYSTIKGKLPKYTQKPCEDKLVFREETAGERWPGVGYACRKGLKSDNYNQDDFCITRKGEQLLLSVFDGHGPDGHYISAYAREKLPQLILDESDPNRIGQHIKEAFEKVHSEIVENHSDFNSDLSGTTASIVVITGNRLFTAHVGDSKVVLGRKVLGEYDVDVLTQDHKPSNPREKERIEASGGEVKRLPGDFPFRAFFAGTGFPGLAVSRSIGDAMAHQIGITHIPEVTTLVLPSNHSIVLLCSDGVWEFLSPEDAISLVGSFGREQAQEAAETLAAEAWRKWVSEEQQAVDDITVVLAFLGN